MFDIGFWELIIIAVVGVVVIGPDKLPEVARTVVIGMRKFRRMFNDVKYDIERELHLDEIRETIEDEELKSYLEDFRHSTLTFEKEFNQSGKQILADIDAMTHEEHHMLDDTENHYEPDTFSDTGIEEELNIGVNTIEKRDDEQHD